jgi:hypothetical protein
LSEKPRVISYGRLQAGLPFLFLLTAFLCNFRRFFFDDEILTVRLTGLSWDELFRQLVQTEVHPPLSYAVYKLWFGLWQPGVESGQVLSLFLAAFALWWYVRTWARLFPSIGWRFVFVAVHPLLILWAGSVRYYSLLYLCVSASMWFAVQLAQGSRRCREWAWFTAVSIAGMYTEAIYAAVLIPQLALIAWAGRGKARGQAQSGPSFAFLWCCAVGVIALAFSPWMDETFIHYQANLGRFSRFPYIYTLGYMFFASFLGQSIHPFNWPVVIPAVTVFAGLTCAGLVRVFRQQRREAWIWAVLCAGTLLFASLVRLTTCRHWLFLPGLVLIPALYGLAQIRRRGVRIACTVLVAAVSLTGTTNVVLKRELHKSGVSDPLGEILSMVEYSVREEPSSAVFSYYRSLDYYLQRAPFCEGRFLQLYGPFDTARRNVEAALRDAPAQVVYIWSYEGGDPEREAIEGMVRRALAEKGYRIFREEKISAHDLARWAARYMSPAFHNPRGYRFIIEVYRLGVPEGG